MFKSAVFVLVVVCNYSSVFWDTGHSQIWWIDICNCGFQLNEHGKGQNVRISTLRKGSNNGLGETLKNSVCLVEIRETERDGGINWGAISVKSLLIQLWNLKLISSSSVSISFFCLTAAVSSSLYLFNCCLLSFGHSLRDGLSFLPVKWVYCCCLLAHISFHCLKPFLLY